MEKIRTFIADKDSERLPFRIHMAGITYPTQGYEISRNSSEYYVLEYVTEGSGVVSVNGETFSVTAGDVYLLPRGSRHHYYASKSDPFSKMWINCDGPLCDRLVEAYRVADRYHFRSLEAQRHLFEKLLRVAEEFSAPEAHLKCGVIFHEIIASLSATLAPVSDENEYAAAAKRFCDRSIYKKLTAADVAREVGLSASHLGRLFASEYGITLYAYILGLKLDTAKTLLRGTTMQVAEVAHALRFTDEHYFSNVFKKKTGVTPGEWRRGKEGV